MSSLRAEPLRLDLEALPRELHASFQSASRLIKADLDLSFRRTEDEALVELKGVARLPFRAFELSARSVRRASAEGWRLIECEESWGIGTRTWRAEENDGAAEALSALEVPLAIRSQFRLEPRSWTANVVAGGKVRALSGEQSYVPGAGWRLGLASQGVALLSGAEADLDEKDGSLLATRARLPLIGSIELIRAQ